VRQNLTRHLFSLNEQEFEIRLMEELENFDERHNLWMTEDVAHAFLGSLAKQ